MAAAVSALEKAFGEPKWSGPVDPVDVLVRTILSQNTNDRNRDRAYEELRRRYPTWAEVADAEPEGIALAIRVAGLSRQKSVVIRDVLRWIRDTVGGFNLSKLCQMDVQEAVAWLGQLKGIGVKTVAVVLMFACGRDVFPVDTHVHRIVQRLGFVPVGASAEKTFWLMAPVVPAGKGYSFHLNLLRLGRSICRARAPKCGSCPLASLCPYPQASSTGKGVAAQG